MFLLNKKTYFDNFFLKIKLKVIALKNIKKYEFFFNVINYKFALIKLVHEKNINLIYYIIVILSTKSNIFFHVINCFGLELFSFSTSLLNSNKQKLKQTQYLQKFLEFLLLKMKFLTNKPLAIHFFNVDLSFDFLIQQFYLKLILLSVKIFVNICYNGCRKKKFKRKKSLIGLEKVAEFG